MKYPEAFKSTLKELHKLVMKKYAAMKKINFFYVMKSS